MSLVGIYAVHMTSAQAPVLPPPSPPHPLGRFEAGKDAHLSYLPLAHVYERMMIETSIALGAKIGFWRVSRGGGHVTG